MDEFSENQLFPRDKRFVLRLLAAMTGALLLGLWLFGELSDPKIGGCAAEAFKALTFDG
ncbi:MAG: hypothetical protein IPJ88_18470 [Myxococcales bacterium]|nr:MAG: hypothetical protein IPJ88_18470 [Myxococcales bacterium]